MKVSLKEKGLLCNSILPSQISRYFSVGTDWADLITRGECYVVYGVEFRENHPWYYLCLDETDPYPSVYPSIIFEVVDPRLSQYWELHTSLSGSQVGTWLLTAKWARKADFYEKLLNGGRKEEAIFCELKNLLNKEFE